MFDDLLNKMQAVQAQLDQVKKQLELVLIDAEAEGGLVKVTINGNRVIKDIFIAQSLIEEGDKEAIEELVRVAVNRAFEKANAMYESEIGKNSSSLLSSLGGL